MSLTAYPTAPSRQTRQEPRNAEANRAVPQIPPIDTRGVPHAVARHPAPHDHRRRTSLGEHRGKAVLIVNVASKCGLTPQYEGLERLQQQYADQGFTVLGAPCNQFKGQEPGSAAEIQEFCSTTYGVTFPLLEKLDVTATSSTRSSRS
jgi:glutathione peroxidase-family protein